jgi:hypothetical protein
MGGKNTFILDEEKSGDNFKRKRKEKKKKKLKKVVNISITIHNFNKTKVITDRNAVNE